MFGMPWDRIVLAGHIVDTKVSGLSNNPEEKNKFVHDPENFQKLPEKIVFH